MERSGTTSHGGGFTLVELLVAMAVVAILMTGVYQFFISQQRTYSTQDEVARMQQEARMCIEMLSRTIQQTGAYQPQIAPAGGANIGGFTISMRGQTLLSASDRYLTLQYDDPYRPLDAGVITAPEVVTFAVSKPAGTATQRVDDSSGTGVEVYFDQNGNGQVEATENFTLDIPLVLDGPPYTLYRITADAANPGGPPQFEALGDLVDNLVLRYFDLNGNPVPRQASGLPGPPPYILTAAERARVRTIEVELLLRTRSADNKFTETFPVDAGTVATYDASGTQQAQATFSVTPDGHRRRLFRSRVSPRNLAANSCGRVELWANPAEPRCPNGTTVTAMVLDGAGLPIAGKTVRFKAESPATATPMTAVTDSSGNASTQVDYTQLSRSIAVSATVQNVDCSAFGGPSSTTLYNALSVNFMPGDSSRIQVEDVPHEYVDAHGSGFLATNNEACSQPGTYDFSARAFDQCNNEVDPLTPVDFSASLGNVGGNPFDQTGDVFTVTLPNGGYPATPSFLSTVDLAAAPAWLLSIDADDDAPHGIGFPFSIYVKPWPPEYFTAAVPAPPTGGIGPFAHTDCPSDPQADRFQIEDCYHNVIYDDVSGSISELFLPDPPVLSDQGTLGDVGPVNPADGSYTISYDPPLCQLPAGAAPVGLRYELNHPSIPLDLGVDFQLNACLSDCTTTASVHGGPSANPLDVLECETPSEVRIEVNSCNLPLSSLAKYNQTVRLTVTGPPGNKASFDPVVAKDWTEVTMTGASAPYTADTTLYIRDNAITGDTFTVLAEYLDSSGNVLWTCDPPVTINISNDCQSLGIFTDPSYDPQYNLLLGANDCLTSIRDLYFEVEDCKFTANQVQASASGAGLWVEIVDSLGVTYDREPVDLDPVVRPAPQSPLYLRSATPLPLVKDNAGPFFVPDGVLAYPPGQTVTVTAAYVDPLDPGDTSCQESAQLTGPVPACFPNAITSGGGAGWNGNFKVHWGDVVVKGNISMPNKFIDKNETVTMTGAPFGGNKYSDRFVDVYAGKQFFNDPATGNYVGEPNPTPNILDQPFKGSGYGNYFRNISSAKINNMIVTIDYETMKFLAQQRGVYWYTVPSGDIRNPVTGQVASLQAVLSLPGPGLENAYFDGDFIFVDTLGTATTPPLTDGAAIDAAGQAGTLPLHQISGSFYTEGIIYLAGSVEFIGLGPGTNVPARSPPELEEHYKHNDATWNPTEDDLPIRSDPTINTRWSGQVGVHINGAVYMDGFFTGAGNPFVYGSITAERGYTGSGTPELWYNYDLNQSGLNESLCVECCTTTISPNASILAWDDPKRDSVQVSALNYSGFPLDWWTTDPAVATVVGTGSTVTVTAHSPGETRVKVRDKNNCVAEATITVMDACDLFMMWGNLQPSWGTVLPGESQTYTVDYSPSGSVNWILDAWPPAGSTLISSGATWAEVMGNCPWTWADVIAEDPRCGAANRLWGWLWVDSPPNWSCTMSLAQKPTTVLEKTSFDFRVTNPSCGADVNWWVWASDGTDGSAYGTLTVDPADSTRATFDATANSGAVTIDVGAWDGSCWDEAIFTVGGCATLAVSQNPAGSPLMVGSSYTLTASGGAEPYTWAVNAAASSGDASLAATDDDEATLKPTLAGSLVLDVTDANGCTGQVSYWVTCTQPTVTIASPANGASFGQQTPNGSKVVWQAIPNDREGANPLDRIARVEFRVYEAVTGTLVQSNTDPASEYCGGSGGAVCAASPWDVSGLPDGEYILQVAAVTTGDHPCGFTTAWASVRIHVFNNSCPLTIGPPDPFSLRRNRDVELQASDHVGTVSWVSQNPAVVSVSPASGDRTTATAANAAGESAVIRAQDSRCFTDYHIDVIP